MVAGWPHSFVVTRNPGPPLGPGCWRYNDFVPGMTPPWPPPTNSPMPPPADCHWAAAPQGSRGASGPGCRLRRETPGPAASRPAEDPDGRLYAVRVFHAPTGARRGPAKARTPRHGAKLALRDPATHPNHAHPSVQKPDRCGSASTAAFERMPQNFDTRARCTDPHGSPPIIEGTAIGLNVEHLPGGRAPMPMWLWASTPVPDDAREVDPHGPCICTTLTEGTAFASRSRTGEGHGDTCRNRQVSDRCTWMVIATHMLLRLARPLAVDCRMPWQQPDPKPRLTPGPIRTTYRWAHRAAAQPATAPFVSSAGLGHSVFRVLPGHPVDAVPSLEKPFSSIIHPSGTIASIASPAIRLHRPGQGGRELPGG